MKAVALAAALACTAFLTVAPPARAKTLELPEANPAATVVLPDAWKPTEVDKGYEATSPDGETYVAVETATAKGLDALIDEDIKFLTKQGVKIDGSTKQDQTVDMNGMKVYMVNWKGRDKDGPTAVTLGIFGVTDNLVVLMTAWSSPAGDKANGAQLTAILESIKRR